MTQTDGSDNYSQGVEALRQTDAGASDADATTSATVAIVGVLEALPPARRPPLDGIRLYEHVDTDALDSLVRNTPATTPLQVEFTVENATVLVTSDGTVVVK